MKRLALLSLIAFLLTACSKDAEQPVQSKFISKIFEYSPAPGQFINEEGTGTKAGAELLIGNKDHLVSLGGFGGYIIFGFDHSITNSDGADLAIYGNAFGVPFEFSEPGIVMVSKDVNGNGLPDDEWYELAGSIHDSSAVIKNYRITYYNPKATADIPWKDNRGGSGAVLLNTFHNHAYYPSFAANQDSISFTGTLLPSTFGLQPGTSVYVNKGFPWGYSDSYLSDTFDISWAVNAAGGKANLASIDFVKVYTGQNSAGNTLLGEVSTEISGAEDLHL